MSAETIMGNKFKKYRAFQEKLILRGLLILGMICFPFIFKKSPSKDWILIYFFKGFLSSFIDNYVVRTGRVRYPVRLLHQWYDTSVLFNYLLFPLVCVFFNQATVRDKPSFIFLKALFFSVPMTLIEWLLEKKSNLIKWEKWSAFHTFVSETMTFLGSRGFIALIRNFLK